jgi:hypothetical protein
MGYSINPCQEFSRFDITILLNGSYGLDKSILKNIFGKFPVAYNQKNVGIYFRLITFQ